jgi:hypothetical protein
MSDAQGVIDKFSLDRYSDDSIVPVGCDVTRFALAQRYAKWLTAPDQASAPDMPGFSKTDLARIAADRGAIVAVAKKRYPKRPEFTVLRIVELRPLRARKNTKSAVRQYSRIIGHNHVASCWA